MKILQWCDEGSTRKMAALLQTHALKYLQFIENMQTHSLNGQM